MRKLSILKEHRPPNIALGGGFDEKSLTVTTSNSRSPKAARSSVKVVMPNAGKSATFKIQESRNSSTRGGGISIMSGGARKVALRKNGAEEVVPWDRNARKNYSSEAR